MISTFYEKAPGWQVQDCPGRCPRCWSFLRRLEERVEMEREIERAGRREREEGGGERVGT